MNVAGLRPLLSKAEEAGGRAQMLRAIVARETPDVLCLLETKLKEEDVAEWEPKLKELLPDYPVV